MKQAKAILLVLLALIAAGGCTSTTPAPTTEPALPTQEAMQWTIVRQMSARHAPAMAAFFDLQSGITVPGVGSEGIWYTGDGGETWARAQLHGYFQGLDILDQDHAWIVGDYGKVRLSTDRGKEWQTLAKIAVGISKYYHNQMIRFADPQTGWAGCLKGLQRTADGGQTWQDLPLPQDVGLIAAIAPRTFQEGHILDENGFLYATTDGGQSWTKRSLGLKTKIETGSPSRMSTVAPHAAIHFFDVRHGLAAISLMHSEARVIVMRTADGGQTWETDPMPAIFPGPLHLAHDGQTLTVTGLNKITVLRYQAP